LLSIAAGWSCDALPSGHWTDGVAWCRQISTATCAVSTIAHRITQQFCQHTKTDLPSPPGQRLNRSTRAVLSGCGAQAAQHHPARCHGWLMAASAERNASPAPFTNHAERLSSWTGAPPANARHLAWPPGSAIPRITKGQPHRGSRSS
jgi:hypothetical protein